MPEYTENELDKVQATVTWLYLVRIVSLHFYTHTYQEISPTKLSGTYFLAKMCRILSPIEINGTSVAMKFNLPAFCLVMGTQL